MTEEKKPSSVPLLLIALSHTVTDLSQGALPLLLPFLRNAFELSYTQVGLIVLAQNSTSSIVQPLFGYVSDRRTLPWMLPLGVRISGMGLAATGVMPSYLMVLAAVIVGGLGVAAYHPQGSKSVHSITPPALKGRNMAIFSVGGNFGQACGSIFMVFLLTLPGLMSNTLYFCLPAAFTAGLLWWRLPEISPYGTLPRRYLIPC